MDPAATASALSLVILLIAAIAFAVRMSYAPAKGSREETERTPAPVEPALAQPPGAVQPAPGSAAPPSHRRAAAVAGAT